ncbi:MAG TPA: hypothetical protein VHB98_04720 [Chloroflexota bacterium]|nr:hypothetical protein [Chloroflexota bacterium]
MAVSALTLPEARERVDRLANTSAEFHIAATPDAPDAQETVQIITGFLRACDDVLLALDPAATADRQEAHRLMRMTRGLRNAFYLLLIAWAPELASYWDPERQAQLRAADQELTPQDRSRILEEANADYARLKEDPAAWSDLRTEDALWEATVADGLGGL